MELICKTVAPDSPHEILKNVLFAFDNSPPREGCLPARSPGCRKIATLAETIVLKLQWGHKAHVDSRACVPLSGIDISFFLFLFFWGGGVILFVDLDHQRQNYMRAGAYLGR